MAIRILVVVADPRTRMLFSTFCRENNYTVDWAATALDAWAKCLACSPDILVLDLDSVDTVDSELVWHVCGLCNVLLLKGSRPLRSPARIGDPPAKATIGKPVRVEDLVAAVQTIRSDQSEYRASLSKSGIVRFGRYAFHHATRKLVSEDRSVYLTNMQTVLLEYFLSRRGVHLSRDQIAKALYGNIQNVNVRSVDVLISRLRTVLGQQRGGDRFIRSIRGIGYVFVADPMDAINVGLDIEPPAKGRKPLFEADAH